MENNRQETQSNQIHTRNVKTTQRGITGSIHTCILCNISLVFVLWLGVLLTQNLYV